MNETFVTMSGYVATEPQARETKAGVPFVTFRLASTPRRIDATTGQYADAETSFVNVTAFRALGLNVAESVRKGHPVVVYGRMRVNQWTGADGRSGTSVDVDAYTVGFDLAKGRATFERTARPPLDDSHRRAGPVTVVAQGPGPLDVQGPRPVDGQGSGALDGQEAAGRELGLVGAG